MRILLGPTLLVVDAAPENQALGTALCLVLIPCMAAAIILPRWWSVLLSVLAAVAWLFVGILGEGTHC